MRTHFTLLFVLLLNTSFVRSQSFGIKGGLNLANMTISQNGSDFSSEMVTGYQIGPVVDFKLTDKFHFNTGLLYSLKGYNLSSGGLTEAANIMNGKSTFEYFVVPMNLAYKFPINTRSKLFVQAGPYVGYCLSAKTTKAEVTLDMFSYGNIQRFDYGFGFGGGVEVGRIVVSLNYELGLANQYSYPTVDASFKNNVLQGSIAFMFGNVKK